MLLRSTRHWTSRLRPCQCAPATRNQNHSRAFQTSFLNARSKTLFLRTSGAHRPNRRASLGETTVQAIRGVKQHSTVNTASAPAKPSKSRNYILIFAAAAISTAVVAAAAAAVQSPQPTLCDSPTRDQPYQDKRDPSLPRFRLSEVRKHDASSGSPWVVRNDKVYDITDWVAAHPGGDVILRAAGASIDPYWDIFAIHKNDYVYDILAQYLIGYVHGDDLVDGRPAQETIEDPFAGDPERHPDLVTLTAKPRNAETPSSYLTSEFLTPNELFYVRNHMWVPEVPASPDAHSLTVELHDGTTREYTLADLKTRFRPHRVTAVLQCSGNRRQHMTEGSGRKANGLPWTVGAISNACWEGARLADVLADAGFDLDEARAGAGEARHVQFSGLEAYGASIPLRKAVDPQGDVLLAYGMNGRPLPRDHGYPLRAIVPGHVAARSVKWLNRVALSDEESASQWQRRDYKCFGPNQTKAVDWDAAPAIQEMPVQSAVARCQLGGWTTEAAAVEDESLSRESEETRGTLHRRLGQNASLSGYAYAGGGRAIIRVDVSLDGGKTWAQAELLSDCDGADSPCHGFGAWSWKRWTFDGFVPADAFGPGQEGDGVGKEDGGKQTAQRCATIVVKATDDAYNTQPESHAATWNLRGNLATAWHRLKVCSECPSAGAFKEAAASLSEHKGDGS